MKKNILKVFAGIGYWIVSLTWGALMTIPGLLITGFCILFLHGKPHRNGFSYIVEIGGDWGGLEIGAVALCGNYYKTSYWTNIAPHEFGHSIQQLIFGPLQVFIVGIPSAVRYWYQRLTPNKPHKAYDDIWFEYTASKWGTTCINWIDDTDIQYTFKRSKKVKHIK